MKSKSYYALELCFKGTRYLGWQKQKDFFPTVQDELDKALIKVFKGNDIKTVASGRTDTGVHALALVVKLEVPFFIEEASLVKALNVNLPDDIRVNKVKLAREDFRPTYDGKSREYFYLFSVNRELSPFEKDHVANINGAWNLSLAEEACSMFIGKHNFVNYKCVGSESKTFEREIFDCRIEACGESFHGMFGEHYKISIKGSGFLKQMVRLIVGAIWAYGQGKLNSDDIQKSLRDELPQKLAPVAPACGLYKSSVEY